MVDYFCKSFLFLLSKHPNPRSASLRWRRKLLLQLPCQPRKSPRPSQLLLRSLSPPLPPPLLLRWETRLVIWRSMSLTWDPSLALTTGSSTPLEESLVWYSTDGLNTPLLPVCVHTLLVCSPVTLLSFQPLPLPTVISPEHLNAEQDFLFLVLHTRFLVKHVVLKLLALSKLSLAPSSNSSSMKPAIIQSPTGQSTG